MGNCTTTESTTTIRDKSDRATYNENGSKTAPVEEQGNTESGVKNNGLPSPPVPPPETDVILYDESTGTEYRVKANQNITVWSTVKEACTKGDRDVRKITYGGTEISKTQTWGELDVSDDATLIVATFSTFATSVQRRVPWPTRRHSQ